MGPDIITKVHIKKVAYRIRDRELDMIAKQRFGVLSFKVEGRKDGASQIR